MTDGYQKGDRPVARKLGNPFHILQLVVSQKLGFEKLSQGEKGASAEKVKKKFVSPIDLFFHPFVRPHGIDQTV